MPRPRDLRRAADALGGGGDLRWVRSPGRVNLIGEHTDYNDGLVLPLAIDREVVVAWRPRTDGRVRVQSLELGGTVEVDAGSAGLGDGAGAAPLPGGDWGALVAALVDRLASDGRAPIGLDAAVASAVPVGSGLSSSAAFTVGVGMALLAAAGDTEPDRRALALACRDAERNATGVPVGSMDPMACLLGTEGDALLIDCRDLRTQDVPIPRGLAVLVVHSGIARTLATSAYADRRAACVAAAERLGLTSLRDAIPALVANDPIARHVVTENIRVREMVDALRRTDRARIGELLLASHASLRDDFAVSTPELDLLVNELVDAGALGARLTGAGFGGCVVAIVQRNHADDIGARAAARYRDTTGLVPSAFVVHAVAGASAFSV